MNDKNRIFRSDYLFSSNSFLVGMGSVFGVFDPYFSYNSSPSEIEADSKALRVDWGAVGEDIQCSINTQKNLDQRKENDKEYSS